MTGRIMLLFLFMAGISFSCSKDKDPVEDNSVSRADFERKFFNITGAEFMDRGLPAWTSQTLAIFDIQGNSTILPGGTNLIHLYASDEATQVIVGVKDEMGYFVKPLVADKGTGSRGTLSMSDLQLLIGQQAEGSFTIAFSVGDASGSFSAYEYLDVDFMQSGTGLLQISLSWDQLNDVDLHLIDPLGEEIYYANPTSSSGGQLDVDSNAACVIDEINNENIFYEDSPEVTIPQGEYEVLVDLWSNCNVEPNTMYSVVVYYGGELIATTAGTNPYTGLLTPETTEMVSVMKFNIDGPPAPRSHNNENQVLTQNVYKFSFDKNNKVFKNYNIKN